MKYLVVALCLLCNPSLLFAYTPTYGCFVENYAFDCSNREVNCGGNSYQNAIDFGYTVGSLCDDYVYCAQQWASEKSAKETALNHETSCINDYNGLVDDYNSLLKSYKSKVALEKKLRKVCGAKCKKIK